ncbi:MAG: type IV secretory system conjugative DNA transfer family protein [Acidimicrobiales bacterium]
MGSSLYLGACPGGWAWAGSQQAVLVLGPPRSGKSTSVVIPNVLCAEGAVVSTSTKPDVLAATWAHRSRLGRCWLFDPSGEVEVPPGLEPLRWSPVTASIDWDGARFMARALVAAWPGATRSTEATYWRARSQLLLGPLLHAAALGGLPMAAVVGWVNRRELEPAHAVLAGAGAGSEVAADVLVGLSTGEERELSNVFSTATTALQAYQGRAALDGSVDPNFDPTRFVASADTVYICSSSRAQDLVAPLVVGLVQEVVTAAYRRAAGPAAGDDTSARPVVLALDEVANIAPLPDLPRIVSEGGGQGVLTLACFQDLAQARARWGPEADGFLSTLGGKLVLPGIGDTRTLEALSLLCGETDVPVRSASRTAQRWRPGRASRTTTWSTSRRRRLPVDAISRGSPGQALYLEGGARPATVALTPCFDTPPWRDLVAPLGHLAERPLAPAPPARERSGPDLGR